MTIQFSQQGMAALPLNLCQGTSAFVRRLVNARTDPAKARVLTWLLKIDDERLAGFGLTPGGYRHPARNELPDKPRWRLI